MSTSITKLGAGPGPFRVIQGGRYAAPTAASEPAALTRGSVAEAGADRLRAVVLKLPVPESGLSVEQALDEVCRLLHDEELYGIERGAYLCSALEKMGLRFQLANPELGLVREGFLALVWPKRLLAEHPELAALHPVAHPFLMLG